MNGWSRLRMRHTSNYKLATYEQKCEPITMDMVNADLYQIRPAVT
jgi:hypothetical protein